MCLPNVETAVANILPKSAMTVNVNGIPIRANTIQKDRPPVVTGTMLPYPINIEKTQCKKSYPDTKVREKLFS